ncbi:class I SAM-dependent methyltransferase [Pseudomonas sp. SGAir0191]|uniref:methyltransferase domain-containing protein n=1 Tax=Pseudomonas sp. SGAir0191 TaxID=2217867 RepID=UPI000C2C6586|nr:methyltransferase domain-containing protein [Pseudomonas sp. SGAir0191]AUA31671.1 class I SAM-dependent methyltransferase [Pseudomonas sp. SGAir0191]
MNEVAFEIVTPGVLKIVPEVKGPFEIEFDGTKYFRFMDYFYIQKENLDELLPVEVSNLCRARAKYPSLISPVNKEVREIFERLAHKICPTSLLEIGAGIHPVFSKAAPEAMRYVLSDADSEVVKHHVNLKTDCYLFSEKHCQVPLEDNNFEMVIAVFVLHFPFHKSQLVEIYKRLKNTGIVIANVYRRSSTSRELLINEMRCAGFKIKRVSDPKKLCAEHEYWILGKQDAQIEFCASRLLELIS